MTLLQQIQNRLKKDDISDIVTKLGYTTSKSTKVAQILTNLLKAADISEYLDKGYYDFRYDSHTLLKTLCELLDIPRTDYETAIQEYEDKKRKLQALQDPYIFVYTNFKRQSEPIFALALMEGKRRIKIDKEMYLSKSEEEVHTYISNAVKLHYKLCNGKLSLWGKIKSYIYYDTKGKKTVYSVLGDIIEDDDIQETRASVTINNKTVYHYSTMRT